MDNKEEVGDLKTDIAVLRVNLQNIERYFSSIEKNVLKVERVSDQILLATSRLDKIQEDLKSVRVDADLRRRESENSVREIKQQMTSMSSSNEKAFTDNINSVLDEVKILKNATAISFEKVYTAIAKNRDELDDEIRTLESRVSKLEQWKWWVMGAGAVLITLSTQVWSLFVG
jgi:chromosome segregation ATPase